ncbi:MAG TPA: T9SS type A sorting domain-containing protein, partial [Ignavibacteriaceae bacterium]|nr:T9SS type A sorting domain-containing protein [Ignavibacteriaceae bacterium]
SVKIVVYNSAGMEITALVDSELSAGKYETSFTALDLSSGIYFYKLESGSFSSIKKMTILK